MEGLPVRFTMKDHLACRAYPVIESEPISLDEKCKFCKECGTAEENLEF